MAASAAAVQQQPAVKQHPLFKQAAKLRTDVLDFNGKVTGKITDNGPLLTQAAGLLGRVQHVIGKCIVQLVDVSQKVKDEQIVDALIVALDTRRQLPTADIERTSATYGKGKDTTTSPTFFNPSDATILEKPTALPLTEVASQLEKNKAEDALKLFESDAFTEEQRNVVYANITALGLPVQGKAFFENADVTLAAKKEVLALAAAQLYRFDEVALDVAALSIRAFNLNTKAQPTVAVAQEAAAPAEPQYTVEPTDLALTALAAISAAETAAPADGTAEPVAKTPETTESAPAEAAAPTAPVLYPAAPTAPTPVPVADKQANRLARARAQGEQAANTPVVPANAADKPAAPAKDEPKAADAPQKGSQVASMKDLLQRASQQQVTEPAAAAKPAEPAATPVAAPAAAKPATAAPAATAPVVASAPAAKPATAAPAAATPVVASAPAAKPATAATPVAAPAPAAATTMVRKTEPKEVEKTLESIIKFADMVVNNPSIAKRKPELNLGTITNLISQLPEANEKAICDKLAKEPILANLATLKEAVTAELAKVRGAQQD